MSNGFHVRRVVWGWLMAKEERREGETIRRAILMVERAALAVFLIGLLTAAALLAASRAVAHDWFDWDCCSDRDCRVVPDGTINELPDGSGWKVAGFPTIIKRGDPRARPTKSGQEAVCSGSLTLRCIYYRPSSM